MSFGAGGFDMWLIKTDGNGTEQWSATYGSGKYHETSYCARPATDGGYVLTGMSSPVDGDTGDVWLIKTDDQGVELWNMYLGGRKNEIAYMVQPTADGGYTVAGYTESYGNGKHDFWLVKLFHPDDNHPPTTPNISGPSWGKTGMAYDYTIIAHDSDDDDVYYRVDWDQNGSFTDWIGPYTSGEEIVLSHVWQEKGIYAIRVQARDHRHTESNWSEPLLISMPKNRMYCTIQLLFERFLDLSPFFDFLVNSAG